jgi:hypothetical protein
LKFIGVFIILLAWNSLAYEFTLVYALWLVVGLITVMGKDGVNAVKGLFNDK